MSLAPYVNVLVLFLTLWVLGGLGCLAAYRLGTWRFLGGVVAGFLLSPLVLGQIAPDLHRELLIGGASEHRQLQTLIHQREGDRETLEQTGVSKVALEEFDKETHRKLSQLQLRELAAEAALMWTTITALMLPMVFFVTVHIYLEFFGRATERDGLWRYVVVPITTAMVGADMFWWERWDFLNLILCTAIAALCFFVRGRHRAWRAAKQGEPGR